MRINIYKSSNSLFAQAIRAGSILTSQIENGMNQGMKEKKNNNYDVSQPGKVESETLQRYSVFPGQVLGSRGACVT